MFVLQSTNRSTVSSIEFHGPKASCDGDNARCDKPYDIVLTLTLSYTVMILIIHTPKKQLRFWEYELLEVKK